MLTNNKKRSFVKLIALTLAALMVFSVCLTGCTDEDARLAADAAKDAADKAQSTADAAQTAADGKTTAEAVAAQIAEALKPYLKAEDAVSEADVDKKVADLKAAIEASLKDYQAKGDYATKADLNKYQAKGDYATKADLKALSGFASSSELKTLSDKVANLTKSAVTAAQVKTIVTETLVDYATTAYVDAAIAKAAAAEREITTADIAEAIEAALADYDLTVQDRIDALEKALTEKIEAYFVGYDAEEVVALLGKVDKAMNAEEWAAATVMVTRVLKKASDLFDKVVNNSYTQDRKAEINTIMGTINGLNTGVVIFETESNSAGSYLKDAHYDYMHSGDTTHTGVDVRTASAKILTDLTVFILRAATVKEISGIEAAIDKATAVATFKDDIKVWRNDLYTIGEVVPVIANRANNTQATWSALNSDHGTMYHNVVYKNGSVKKAQVATAAHRAQYNEDVANLEKLVVEYTLESMRFGTSSDSASFGNYNAGAVMALYSKTTNNVINYKWVTPGTYKNESWLGMNVSALTGTTTGSDGWSLVGIFAGIDSSNVPAKAAAMTEYTTLKNRNWVPDVYGDADKFGYVMQGYYDNQFLDPEIKVDLVDGMWATNGSELKELLNAYTVGTTTGGYKAVTLAETYNALAQMIWDAENANAKANAIFTGIPAHSSDVISNTNYLWHIGHNFKDNSNDAGHQCGCTLLTDDQYVAALKDYMVEHTEDETYAQVPDHWEIPVWLTPVYDVTGTDAPWQLMTNENAQTVDVYFNYAHNINGEGYMPESYDFITRYDLYLKLVKQAWKLLYEKYKSYAAQILLTMRNDFRVAAKAAVVANGANGTAYTGKASDAALALDLELITVDLAKKWTADDAATPADESFLGNYYEGVNGWAWSIGNKVVKQVGPSYNMEGLDHYYDYNDVAARQNVAGASTIHSDVIGALKASQLLIDIELDSVTVGPRKEILTEAENFKNSGKTEFDWKRDNVKRVQDAFDEELAVAMANFEEIMYRYMHKEINEAYVNLAYAAINALAAPAETVNALNPHADDNYGAGVATYFSKNPAGAADQYAAEMAHFMQVYVTGYAKNAVAGYAQGYNEVRNDKGVLVGITYKTSASYPNGVTVVPADVFNKLDANVLSAADFAVGETIAYPATAALANAKAIYADAINVMANAAVKFRFNDYIQHAKDAAYFAYLAYITVAPGIEARLVLDAEYNEAVNALTIIQYYSERGLIADMDYLNTYVTQILGVAIANNSPYYTLIAKDTDYAKQLKNIKSSTALVDNKAATLNKVYDFANFTVAEKKDFFKEAWVADVDLNNNGNKRENDNEKYGGNILVIVPQSPMNGLASDNNYFATGSAALAFDMALNGNAKADNGTKLY